MVEGYRGFVNVLNKSFRMGESSLSRMVTVNMESIPGETVSDGAEVLGLELSVHGGLTPGCPKCALRRVSHVVEFST